ncbi:hypothetical protein MMC14_003863 [Varicellaria rhodocarpa]|nr:hypothetical protein [Varicellaria rhodocarpa]
MGVGFGGAGGEQCPALREKVAFTNVFAIDGVKVAMHPGYIITKEGVEVGLTPNNTRGFKMMKLDRWPGSTGTDWKRPNMSISLDGSEWNVGSALFDTGISWSYVRLDYNTYNHAQTECFDGHTILRLESNVTMIVGNGIARYEIIAGDPANPMDPLLGQYRLEKPSAKGPFLHTGRFFYNDYDVMFDEQCGWFGLKLSREEVDSFRGTTAQQVLELSQT